MKRKKDVVKAIIFDIGGVLQLGEQQRKKAQQKHASGIHEQIAKKLKISIDQYFDSIDTAYSLSMEGKISEKSLLKILSTNLKISERRLKKLYFLTYQKKFKVNKQLFKQAFKLQKLGYKIAILSDQWHLSKPAHVPKKLFDRFDAVIVSCDVGIRKPDPKIYKLVLKKLKIKSSEGIFIDNQTWNLKPAEKLGIKTILFKDNKQFFKEKLWKSLFKQPV